MSVMVTCRLRRAAGRSAVNGRERRSAAVPERASTVPGDGLFRRTARHQRLPAGRQRPRSQQSCTVLPRIRQAHTQLFPFLFLYKPVVNCTANVLFSRFFIFCISALQ